MGRRERDPAGITAARITPQALAAIETGQSTPGPVMLAALAHALGCPPTELHITGHPGGYWDVICAALPPLTDSEITTVATVLRRISAGVFDDVPKQGSSENGTAELMDQRPAQVSW